MATPRPFSMLDVLLDAEPLSQVVFVHDYIQLVFQGTYFNLYNRVTVHRGGCTLGSSDAGFADELRRLIGERVVDTSSEEGQFSAVKFERGTQVSVSLRAEDASGPEAFELGDNKGPMRRRAEHMTRCALTAACTRTRARTARAGKAGR